MTYPQMVGQNNQTNPLFITMYQSEKKKASNVGETMILLAYCVELILRADLANLVITV
jgi:hypothetical protein